MKSYRHKNEQGAVDWWMVATIGLIVLFLAAGSLAIWAFINYNDQKNNVDSKIAVAVAEAKKIQADEDEAKFIERDKEPNRDFVGPDDYGRLTFSYPKTWSVYVGNDSTSSGAYQAYLNPVTVPPVSDKQQFALRVTIETRDYDRVVSGYQRLVTDGKLSSSSVTVNGQSGTRLDGNFSDDIRGAAVIFKIRDKTITMRTDADTFKPDFETLVSTVTFNQ